MDAMRTHVNVRRLLCGTGISLLAACSSPNAPTPRTADLPIPVDMAQLAALRASVEDVAIILVDEGQDPAAVASEMGLTPRRIFRHVVNGFSASLPEGGAAVALETPEVSEIHPVEIFTT